MRNKGDKYRPVVTVLKAKKGIPTKISVSGKVYSLVHTDHINGNANKVKKRRGGVNER